MYATDHEIVSQRRDKKKKKNTQTCAWYRIAGITYISTYLGKYVRIFSFGIVSSGTNDTVPMWAWATRSSQVRADSRNKKETDYLNVVDDARSETGSRKNLTATKVLDENAWNNGGRRVDQLLVVWSREACRLSNHR